jgi:flavorubredoxin
VGYGNPEVLYEDEKHKFIWLGAGDPKNEDGMPSHQYMIVDVDEGYVIDPGGHNIFGRVHSNISEFVDPEKIRTFFLSHQDPDIAAGIDLWLQKSPRAMVAMSGLWIRFLLHYPLTDIPELFAIGDDGDYMRLKSGGELRFIPAHFLHSPGNFQLYDSRSKILFSGDVGAATVLIDENVPVVKDFDEHVGLMEPFHKRYMACNKAVKNYLDKLESLNFEIRMICPQHGAIMQGDDVPRFFDWLRRLDVGVDA